MTNTELIERLRETASKGVSVWGDLQMEAADTIEAQARDLAAALEQVAALQEDADRVDWLADPANEIGEVRLPTDCVLQNLGSLRDAIDSARKEKS